MGVTTIRIMGKAPLPMFTMQGWACVPSSPLKVNVEYDNRTGYYGSTNGIIVDAFYDINKKLRWLGVSRTMFTSGIP